MLKYGPWSAAGELRRLVWSAYDGTNPTFNANSPAPNYCTKPTTIYPINWSECDGGRLEPSREIEFQHAKLLDRTFDLIAGLQPHLFLSRHSEDDAGGRAGEDDIAGLQSKQP
jgi:hypothetical protein